MCEVVFNRFERELDNQILVIVKAFYFDNSILDLKRARAMNFILSVRFKNEKHFTKLFNGIAELLFCVTHT